MIEDEKDRLLDLFADEQRWCQHAEAMNQEQDPVRYDDESAAAWDLVGGLCYLFGWPRARQLFGELEGHIVGRPGTASDLDADIAAMTALVEFNDARDTTYDKVMATLRELEVRPGRSSSDDRNSM